MTDEPQDPQKEIVIDEDWKNRVDAEKEALRQQQESGGAPPEPEPPAGETPPKEAPSRREARSLPPPDLAFLFGNLYLQAAMSLGLVPNPLTKKSDVDFAQAKHTIDLLQVLQQKTEGNRTPDETEELEAILHHLRLAYVEVQTRK